MGEYSRVHVNKKLMLKVNFLEPRKLVHLLLIDLKELGIKRQ